MIRLFFRVCFILFGLTSVANAAILVNSQIEYDVYLAGIYVGQSKHKVELNDNNYTINSISTPSKLLSVIKNTKFEIISSGLVLTNNRIKPLIYKQIVDDKVSISGVIDYKKGVAVIKKGDEVHEYEITDGVLDLLSVFYVIASSMDSNLDNRLVALKNKVENYKFSKTMKQKMDLVEANELEVNCKTANYGANESTTVCSSNKYENLPLYVKVVDKKQVSYVLKARVINIK